MKITGSAMLALLAASLSLSVFAQPGPGGGPRGGGFAFDQDNTRGWSLMTPEERNAHREKMMSFKTYDECKAYQDEQHALMEARAREKGKTLPASRANACDHMKARGVLK